MPLLFDSLLGLGGIWLAWQALSSDNLFRAIVLFVAFGLMLALVWVRLAAPDIALAEAAIGAGVTGALLLAALARLDVVVHEEATNPEPSQPSWHRPGSGFVALLTAGLFIALVYTLYHLPVDTPGLRRDVIAQLDNSGVRHPVTAVLLNFRGYDTLLEILVLLLALLGVGSLGKCHRQAVTATGPVLDALSRLLAPVLVLVAAYLLWLGASAPGGAFQAGAVLAAGGILLLLSGWRLPARFARWPWRLLLALGPVLFLVLALITLWLEGKLLQYPPAQAGGWILLIEASASLSIGAILVALFMGGDAEPEHKDE
ncbi:hydrogenase subunit MbhD domain-containing protein [Thiohalophilus sp.]|uniref:hydrogenase subunit MbhD domain-containing protein n=1 Tax=Thiohalophilus sp. TaxID=3028392 RepID=UPI003A101211